MFALLSLPLRWLQAHNRSVKTVLMSDDSTFGISVGDDRCLNASLALLFGKPHEYV